MWNISKPNFHLKTLFDFYLKNFIKTQKISSLNSKNIPKRSNLLNKYKYHNFNGLIVYYNEIINQNKYETISP